MIAGGLTLVEPADDESHDLSAVISRYKDGVDLVILGGGDGTLHRALEALVATQLPLGILPLGTANDFARTLNLPIDTHEACEVILTGHAEAVDLGEVNGKLFCNVSSIGLAVQVTNQLKQKSKKQWGVVAYMFAAIQAIRRQRRLLAVIEGEGGVFFVRTAQVTIGNGRYFGGGMSVHESATATDGLLHLFSLEVDNWWQIIKILPWMWKGRLHYCSRVRTLSSNWFTIRTPDGVYPLTADGEFVCSTPIRFRCHPGVLKVLTVAAKDDPPSVPYSEVGLVRVSSNS